jgi:hypothetical protein
MQDPVFIIAVSPIEQDSVAIEGKNSNRALVFVVGRTLFELHVFSQEPYGSWFVVFVVIEGVLGLECMRRVEQNYQKAKECLCSFSV